MKTKRILAIMFCVVMALSLLAGCGGSEEESTAAPEADAAQAAAAEAVEVAVAPVDAAESGDASGEVSGEAPEMKQEAADPAGYSADFAGYKEYVLTAIEALETESGFDLSAFKTEVEAAADENADVFVNMQSQNTVVTYDTFLAAN